MVAPVRSTRGGDFVNELLRILQQSATVPPQRTGPVVGLGQSLLNWLGEPTGPQLGPVEPGAAEGADATGVPPPMPLPAASPPPPPAPLGGGGGAPGGGLGGINPREGLGPPPGWAATTGMSGGLGGPGGPNPYMGQEDYMQQHPMDYIVNMLRDTGVTDPYANPFARANMQRFDEPTVHALFDMWQALNANGTMEQFLPQFMSGGLNPTSLIQQIAAAAQGNPDLLALFKPEEFAAIQEKARGSSPRNAAARERAFAKRAAEQRQAAIRTEEGRNKYLDTDWIRLLAGGG